MSHHWGSYLDGTYCQSFVAMLGIVFSFDVLFCPLACVQLDSDICGKGLEQRTSAPDSHYRIFKVMSMSKVSFCTSIESPNLAFEQMMFMSDYRRTDLPTIASVANSLLQCKDIAIHITRFFWVTYIGGRCSVHMS